MKNTNSMPAKGLIMLFVSLIVCAVSVQDVHAKKQANIPASAAASLPNTPYLPPYPGYTHSAEVMATQQSDGGVNYSVGFETTEYPERVIGWYKSSFNQYGWTQDGQSTSYNVQAQKGKNISMRVVVSTPKKACSRAHVQFYYNIVGRDLSLVSDAAGASQVH